MYPLPCFLSGLQDAPLKGSMVSKSIHSLTNLLTCLIEKCKWSGWYLRPKQENKRNIWVVLISVSARVPWLSRKKCPRNTFTHCSAAVLPLGETGILKLTLYVSSLVGTPKVGMWLHQLGVEEG